MAKKYNETDALRIVKDLFNLLMGDSKRFATLRNKFKKSVAEFKEKDGKIVSVSFNAVGNDVINQELNDAIESLRGYAARSAKKQAEFDTIIAGEGLDVEAAKAGKPKSIKVAKASDGKVKKVAKDSSLPKEKEPKEVKKVKNKNEPVKKAIKAESKKTSTKVASGTKATKELDPTDQQIKEFIESLDGTELKQLIKTTLDAFAGDSKLSATMQNWVSKTNNDKDAAIGMFSSAYKRKPNNSKMKDLYSKFIIFKTDKPAAKDEPKENVEEFAKTEVDTTNPIQTEVVENTEEKPNNLLAILPGLLNKKVIAEPSKFKGTDTPIVTLSEIYNGNIPERIEYGYVDNITDILFDLHSTVLGIAENNFDELSSIEANIMSLKIPNSTITTTFIQNFIGFINKAPGLGSVIERKSVLNQFSFCLKEGLEHMGIGVEDTKKETFEFYMENTLKLTMIQVYTLNRFIISHLLGLVAVDALENENDKMLSKLFEVSIEYFINAGYFEKVTNGWNPIQIIGTTTEIEAGKVIESNDVDDEPINMTEPEEKPKELAGGNIDSRGTIKYTITYSELSFVLNGTQITIQKSDEKYPSILEAVKASDYEKLDTLIITETSIKNNIEKFLNEENIGSLVSDDYEDTKVIKIEIVDKTLICNGKKFGGKLSLEFIKYAAQNDAITVAQFKRFIYNCSLNPSMDSVKELYDFVIKNTLKVTPSGTILLYKWVKDNYFDAHTGKFDNSPGKTVWMDRKKVNSNRNETCSNGLHLCSFGYSKFSQRLLICELHPKNSVSIPVDYNQSKMRCCEYSVLIDVTEYYSEMLKKGDYLKIGELFHHNSKILEIAIMQKYPEVVRTNSFNGFNGKKGSDIDFANIDFTDTLIKTRVEFTEDSDEENICETLPVTEVVEKLPETIEEVKEDPTGINKEIEPIECKTKPVKEIVETPETPVELMNENLFLKFMKDGHTDKIRKVQGHEDYLNNLNNGLDTVILKIIAQKLNLVIPFKDLRVYDIVEIYVQYRKISNDEVSTAERSTADIKKADEIESSKEISEDSNKDGTKVVETPKVQSTGLFGKVKKFFGGK